MALENVTACPVCGNTTFDQFLTCRDHHYSCEHFSIVQCPTCRLLITTPRPDQNSIGNYYKAADYISHTGTSSGMISALYKLARNIAFKSKHQTIKKYHASGTILDIGCGTGEFVHHMMRQGWQARGLEPSPEARAKALQLNPKKIVSDLHELNGARFDVITLWHVLEHVPYLDAQLRWIKEHLQPNGTIFVAVPNHLSLDAIHYGAHWAGFDVPRHLWHFNQKTMSIILGNYGLHLKALSPMKLDSFYVSMLSEKYLGRGTTASYVHGFFNGWRSNRKARQTGEYSSLLYIIGR